MVKKKLTDYLPNKKKQKASVRIEIDKGLYEEGQRLLKQRGNTVTEFIEAAFTQLLDELKKS